MSLTKFIKDVQKRREAIPTPGAIIYNETAAKALRKPETKIANDVIEKMGSGTKDILDQTEFKDSYHMELTDVWMKITLKKHK